MLKKPFILLLLAVCTLTTYYCVNYAAGATGAYWSAFDTPEGINSDLSSGFVTFDAADARKDAVDSYGIGPFKSDNTSFSNPDVVLEEETSETPEELPESPYWSEIAVAAGDTLSVLAEKHGVTVADIMKANELTNQHRLRQGQILFIPKSGEHVDETLEQIKKLKNEALAERKSAKPLELSEYVVQTGDTLWSVANKFDLDVNTIYGSNTSLPNPDIVSVGTKLRVPNQDGIFIKVKASQTLDKLAKEYNIFVEAIMAANTMTDQTLTADKEIFLPGAKVMAFVDTPNGKKAVAQQKVNNQRGFGWPVAGKISSPFGWRRDPVRGGRDFHTGIDIRAPRGRTIVASSAGKVVHSGWMGGYGKTIVISHPGNTTTLYAHCSKLLAKVGQNVKRGERIAQVGSTGRSTGNHVHFEVRKNGTPTNPLKSLR